MYRHFFKRFLDLFFALIAIIFLSPLLLVTIFLLHFANKGSGVFFIQERPGKYTKTFKIIKFKTMTDDKDLNGILLPDKYRLTKIGNFIRSTSIDELPQFFNVLKGDMSIIGPRPLLIKYLPLYSEEQSHRHDCRPGITGWAQVNGRNNLSWQEKFELDVWYVDHISFWLDMKILWMTLVKVIKRKDINSPTSVTMEAFTGNE